MHRLMARHSAATASHRGYCARASLTGTLDAASKNDISFAKASLINAYFRQDVGIDGDYYRAIDMPMIGVRRPMLLLKPPAT